MNFKYTNGSSIRIADLIRSALEGLSSYKVSSSNGVFVIKDLIHQLIEKEDPFIKSIAVLGGEKGLNALGTLFYIAYQIGYWVGNKDIVLEKDPKDIIAEPEDLINEIDITKTYTHQET
jgi:hypothetical protein